MNASGAVLAVPSDPRIAASARTWPNPFSNRVEMEFALATPATVRLEVFDVRGRRVHRSTDASLPGGRHVIAWDGRVEDGSPAGEGLYFLRVSGSGISHSRSVVRLN
jgi:flagellar hook assembly protein FlgD